MKRVLDLFAGAGGFSLGFQNAGYIVEHAIEQDEWAAETLHANHATDGTRVWCRDIRRIADAEIKREISPPDVIIGGPPCQGFSIANNGKDPKDPRNSLFWEFLRFVRLLEPRVVLLENVIGILKATTATGERVIDVIESELRNLGYFVATQVLNAEDYGVPQIRRRVFVCACKDRQLVPLPARTHDWTQNDEPLSLFAPPSQHPRRVLTLWDAISDLPEVDVGDCADFYPYTTSAHNDFQALMRLGSSGVYNHAPMRHTPRMIARFRQIAWGQSQSHVPAEFAPRARNSNGEAVGKRYDQNNRRMRPDVPCHTIPASFYANFIHPYLHRNFTPREGARIQSFPDRYVFKGKSTVVSHKLLAREGRHEELKLCQYNQIGNAVPPLLAEALASHIAKELEFPVLDKTVRAAG
jgi:DNA (cytosine-5)-methyltransferase 1